MATLNTLFAVLNASDPAAVKLRMANIAPWVSLELQEGEWLLVAPNGTTTQEVSTRLGFTDPLLKDAGIILRVDSYFGRNYPHIWEWIATKQGAELAIAATV